MAKYRFMMVIEGPCIDCGEPFKAEWIQVDHTRPTTPAGYIRRHRCDECNRTYAGVYPAATNAGATRIKRHEDKALAEAETTAEPQA